MCRGRVSGLKACGAHRCRSDERFDCVGRSCEAGWYPVCFRASFVRRCDVWGVSGLWRTFLRFEYIAHTPTVTRKYGNYRGFTWILQQLCWYLLPPGVKTLHFFITSDIKNYLIRISFGKCLSGNESDSARAAGPPDAVSDTQTVGGTGSVGWSMQTGAEWRLVAHSLGRGLRP